MENCCNRKIRSKNVGHTRLRHDYKTGKIGQMPTNHVNSTPCRQPYKPLSSTHQLISVPENNFVSHPKIVTHDNYRYAQDKLSPQTGQADRLIGEKVSW